MLGKRSITTPGFGWSGKQQRDLCHRWGVILAGGDGTRLLPLTRRITGDDRPKQFCCIVGSETLLRQTQRRVAAIVPPRHILVVLTRAHESFYSNEVSDFAPSCLLIQRYNRGTAPAILYSLTRVQHLDPEGLVAVFPSDHYVCEESVLHRHIDSAFAQAEAHPGTVILLGVSPDTPEIDYGWIHPGLPFSGALTESMFHVDRFWEKPSRTLACSLMNLGCLWNSFIMVGRVDAFLSLIREAVPALFQSFYPVTSSLALTDQASLDNLYSGIPSFNFSRQVLSAKPAALAVLRADGLEWSDLGEPSRVLSLVARKGIQKEWNFDLVAGSSLAMTMSA